MAGRVRVCPQFIEGGRGRLFAMDYVPDPVRNRREYVIFVPPFAEEMNRSRRMAVLQARRLADLGYGAVVFDLYGTGDSAADFKDARWGIWVDDIGAVVRWLRHKGVEAINLLALRLGALLAMEYARRREAHLNRVVLWQPLISGSAALTQFLRLRLAADMKGRTQDKESTRSLRALLTSGSALEVAGYDLAAELASAVDAALLEELAPDDLPATYWLELSAQEGSQLSPGSVRAVEKLQQRGLDIRTAVVVGEPFWSLQEVTVAPELLDATTEVFVGR